MELERVLEATLRLLQERPELAETLRRIAEYEAEHYKDEYFFTLGWEWDSYSPPIPPQTLHMMHLRGVLRQVYKSRSGTGYVTLHPAAVRQALEVFARADIEETHPKAEGEIPRDIFDPVVGYTDVKSTIMKALDSGARVHWLFAGPPASAKTLFLLCLERLPGAGYVLGSRVSRAGLSDYLIETKPRYLLVDEVDKLPNRDLTPLLSLCETGRVIETLYGRRREETLETIVFSAANRLGSLLPEVVSRFEVLVFPEYTREQFSAVCVRLLAREDVEAGLSAYIAAQVWDVLRIRDMREAIRISRLSRTKSEVDELVEVLRRYRPRGRARRR